MYAQCHPAATNALSSKVNSTFKNTAILECRHALAVKIQNIAGLGGITLKVTSTHNTLRRNYFSKDNNKRLQLWETK